ncbi:MAG TPA: NAD(P)H-dependent oxidoreductase [Candidatus Saccharimonadales bacterium]|nr:NAD(P)H-dependent oxidoreductase [Candidatus Saccharimonadales bacterium]
MDEPYVIAILVGTTRERRESIKAARYVAQFGETLPNVEIVFVDPKDFHFAGDGNDQEGKDPRYSEITAKADGFFIITPEYNHSFSGSLKRMLDSESKNYVHKALALAGVSNGGWGGVRAVEALVGPVREMGLVVTYANLYFPRVQDIFDDQGKMRPEYTERYERNLHDAYYELLFLARALRWARLNEQKR